MKRLIFTAGFWKNTGMTCIKYISDSCKTGKNGKKYFPNLPRKKRKYCFPIIAKKRNSSIKGLLPNVILNTFASLSVNSVKDLGYSKTSKTLRFFHFALLRVRMTKIEKGYSATIP